MVYSRAETCPLVRATKPLQKITFFSAFPNVLVVERVVFYTPTETKTGGKKVFVKIQLEKCACGRVAVSAS